jgi:predicted HAD superfamily Cof-like phosphohydrolase
MQHIIEEVFDEIQASNMSKLGDNGKPVLRDDGKILKGPGYFRPDLTKFIKIEK